jgi:hypothetical protein
LVSRPEGITQIQHVIEQSAEGNIFTKVRGSNRMVEKFHNEKLHAHKILVRIPKGKKPLRPGYRWEDNIKMNLKVIECEGINLIQLAQDKF